MLSKDKVLDFVLFLQSKGKASKTVNLYKEVIKFFCNNILKISIALDIRLSKEPRKLPVVFSKQELEKLFTVDQNPKHRLILMLAYGSGLRISEVRDLCVGDLDFDRKILHIKSAKGQKDRITLLPDKISDDLKKYCTAKSYNDPVFESERGGSLHARTLDHIFQHAIKKARRDYKK